jgi:hypothetical protein
MWLLVLQAISAGYDYACTCINSSTAEQTLTTAAVVFSGVPVVLELIEVPYKPDNGPAFMHKYQRVKFRVMKSWKGVDSPYIWVVTGLGRGECGIPYRLDHQETVVANRRGDAGTLETTICDMPGRDRLGRTFEEQLGPAPKEFPQDQNGRSGSCE